MTARATTTVTARLLAAARLTATASMLALGLAAGFGGVGAAQAGEIRIGSVLSATGPAAFLGDPEEKTLKLYAEEINKAGGINGDTIKLVIYDDGGDADKARTFATRLVEEDKVAAVLGGTTSGTTMAMVPVFEDAEMPFISFAGAVGIVEPTKKWVFKTPHTDRMACEKIFEDLKKQNLTKVGIISGTDGFGKSMRDQCVKVNAKYDVEIVAEETYGPRDSDMTAQLTNLKGAPGIQALVNPGMGQGPAIVTRNVRQLGIALPLYQSHGVASKSFIELAGDAAEGVRLPAAAILVAEKLPDSDPQKAIALGYKTSYEAATKGQVSTFGGHAFDALFILKGALERAKSSDAAKIRDEIEKTTGFIGTAGIFNMTPADHMGLDLTAFKMLEVRSGDWTLVE
ncbi:ABC transporter substrate-binding protein [Blastochloris sulfoviridis]|uniref:ABC transporter substrate-binding protein n=2 Tax=Blastochloris sulfoviridis TaxID=50712 RepID=A0A5M6I356_9HYPH|nr:ABC transporter substrate-binding protein [Blastochloris sulfoviridis]